MKKKDFETIELCAKEDEALKILNHVNDMARGSKTVSVYDIRMYLYNNWVGKSNPENIIDGYDK